MSKLYYTTQEKYYPSPLRQLTVARVLSLQFQFRLVPVVVAHLVRTVQLDLVLVRHHPPAPVVVLRVVFQSQLSLLLAARTAFAPLPLPGETADCLHRVDLLEIVRNVAFDLVADFD